mgnify:FL=1
MKHKYYVNKRRQTGSGNNNEIHRDGCPWTWMPSDAKYLGEFDSSEDALQAAKRTYPDADGCAHCCPEINHDKR